MVGRRKLKKEAERLAKKITREAADAILRHYVEAYETDFPGTPRPKNKKKRKLPKPRKLAMRRNPP
jgi:hypothetical protein